MSVKFRLVDIGALEADGILNYDDELKTSYKVYGFYKKYITDHQTFNLNKRSFDKLIESNEEINKLIDDKKLLYLNGLVVVNNNEYVQCGKLTDYALRNAHECALIFDVTSDSRPLSDNVSKFSLCRSAESIVLAQPNIEQLQRNY